MKICPVCGAQCFKDMDICFGCMHRFDAGDSQYMFGKVGSCQEDDSLDEAEIILKKKPMQSEGGFGRERRDARGMAGAQTAKRARHATSVSQIQINADNASNEEGFQAEYQLVISLKPCV